ncbi:cytochrome P450 [Basidiobolus meristosporus CBS 931.73]|uniref:Cytochrome P450 n=1 Tax=Basidiobolus meristosporus CBS 931.73 TaxID=1314790 RepID=A0A1Y1YBB6_9FUNG|nr:cytochrome P450 [Basidiobolus meristosporus CBS 931.73]|eukprot:ORX95056.1 cytochrome P450 [Basidiobolus meristosporus CBS 931.73]
MILTLILAGFALYIFWDIYFKNSQYSHIPGPKGVPIFGNVLQMRFEYLIRDFEAWAWKCATKFSKARPDGFSRGAALSKIAEELHVNGIFTQEGDEWRHSRYWIASAFSPSKVREFKKCIWHHSKRLQEKLREISEKQAKVLASRHGEGTDSTTSRFPILNQHDGDDLTGNIISEIQSVVLSIVCDVSFSWGEENFLSHDVISRSKTFMARMFERAHAVFPIWRFYKGERDIIAEGLSAEFSQRIQTLIDKSQDNLESRTLLDTLLRSTLEADGETDNLSEKRRRMHRLTDDQVKANLMTVIMAGYETTATVMSWVLYELAKNPQYQERVRAELKEAFGDINQLDIDQDISVIEKALNLPEVHLPFIHALIQETLRIHSVAPLFQLTALKDHVIQGVKITKGTELFLLTRVATLRSWPTSDPFKFNPEQWLGENGESESQIKTMNQLGLTFGFGPRVCPGRHLAETELVVLTSLIATNFQLSLIHMPPAMEPVMEKMQFTTYPANIHIRIEPNTTS